MQKRCLFTILTHLLQCYIVPALSDDVVFDTNVLYPENQIGAYCRTGSWDKVILAKLGCNGSRLHIT
jgi:hypothetical protein